MVIRYEAMPSRFTGARNVSVWLPPDYQTSKRRYRVLYMHDGQNIFAGSHAFGGESWRVDAAMEARAAEDPDHAAIVVGVWNTKMRAQDYTPTGIEKAMDSELRTRAIEENGGASGADGYLRFLVEELKPMIDRDYRTKSDPASTFIMGSSMGGLISAYAICEYPHVFAGAGCLSTHWPIVCRGQVYKTHTCDTQAMIKAITTYLDQKLPRPGTHHIWMDHGTQNLDSIYAPYQQAVDQMFTAKGWRQGVDFESRIYDGADHNEASWRARLKEPLAFLLG